MKTKAIEQITTDFEIWEKRNPLGTIRAKGEFDEVLSRLRSLQSQDEATARPTAPATLVEEVEGWLNGFSSNYPNLSALRFIISCYKPTPPPQLVEALEAVIKKKSYADDADECATEIIPVYEIRQVIAKFKEAK